MRRMIVWGVLLALVAVGGFLYMFNREGVMNWVDASRGYPKAKTPQEAVDLFKKALRARKYDKAAKYCTKDYAEQLKKAAEGGKEVGEAIDDVKYRLEKDGVSSKEIETVLAWHDPFPATLDYTLKNITDKDAALYVTATFAEYPKDYEVDAALLKGLYAEQQNPIAVLKEGEEWKIDFKVTPDSRKRLDYFVQRAKAYSTAFRKMSEELRTERTTKAEVDKRFKEIIIEAVRVNK